MKEIARIVTEYNHPIVPSQCVREDEMYAGPPREAGSAGSNHAAHNGVPTVELIKDGDVVQAIDVTCSCGQQIRLHLMYE